MRSLKWVGLAAALLAGCFPFTPTVSFVGKSCNGSVPCPDGLSCIAGSCELSDGGVESTSSGATSTSASSTSNSASSTSGFASSSSSATSSGGHTSSSTGSTTVAGTSSGQATASTGGTSSGGTTTAGSSSGAPTTGSTGTGGSTSTGSGSSGTSSGNGSSSGGSSSGIACSPATCPGGCCDQNGCELGTNPSACGPDGGGVCSVCPNPELCQNGACCGGIGEACCSGPGGSVSCNAGLNCAGGTCFCTTSSCGLGCCDLEGCESGDTSGACGSGGGQCNRCTTFEACESASCVACGGQSEPCCADAGCNDGLSCAGTTCNCSPTSCLDGCCDANGCELAESELVCGTAGIPCQSCNSSTQVCKDGCISCGGPGQPCCLNGSGLATLCDANLSCNGTSCVCTPSSCPNGCCDVNGCHGESLTTCGDGGGACVNCGTGATCLANGACCGGGDQPCCADATCVAGFSCVATSSTCGASTLCLQSVPTYYEQGGVAPTGLAINGSVSSGVDATSLFWTVPTNPGYVASVQTSQRIVFDEPQTYDIPEAVVINSAFSALYWIDDNDLYGCTDLNAGFCTSAVFPLSSVTAQPPGPLVIDPGGSNLYWVEGTTPNQSIQKCALGGTLFTCTLSTLFASAQMNIVALAIDATNLYWEDNGQNDLGIYNLGTAAIAGVSPPGQMSGLAVDSSHIYFGALQDLEVAPIAGGNATTFVAGPTGGCVDAIATDGKNVYWTDACLGTLNKVPVPTCGAPVQTLWNEDATAGLGDKMGLALDPINVYWSDPSNGTVMSIGK